MTIHDPWRDLIVDPLNRDHFVQVYREQRVLVEAVSLFAGAALGRNEAVILVATREHGEAVEQRLGQDGFEVPLLKTWGQLSVLDAEQVLSSFMANDSIDEARFKSVVGGLIGSIKGSGRYRQVRIYGEMVDLLWSHNLPAAARLEELWNDVIQEHSISLFCAYCLTPDGESERVFPPAIRALHTHFIPVEGCA